ncbi:MAG TPA: hypothetical protein VL334_06570 [Anaerolineae bacterium]|nr:hypothetical protein [Anaerolineae bacterium]
MENDVCPLLGLVDEQGAYLTYPSYENRCYSSRAPQPIPLNEQTFFCLGGHQQRCPRFQSRQALMEAQDAQNATDELLVATAAVAGAQDDAFDWVGGSDDEPPTGAEDAIAWPADPTDSNWTEPATNLALPPTPPLPPASSTPADGRARRPVWPLLLAAGTLVAVLMLCGLASAGWLGWQALSSQLALQPTGTPLVEEGGAATPGAGGVVVIVATPTPNPLEATATAEMAATATALALFMATPTPTEVFFFETPTFEAPTFDPSTATPTWTPFAVFETPTPRDTPTFFPTNTPFVNQATATPTWTPVVLVTVTSTGEPFSASFIANPLSIQFGQTSTLTWNVRGVKAMYLNGEAISGPTGSKVVQPTTTTTYVLRMIMPDNSVREETQTVTVSSPSPTATRTATPPPPTYSLSFAEDLSITSISGQDASCRTGSGCTLFQIQVRNTGNQPAEYTLEMNPTIPVGWGVFFCWAADCEFGNAPPARALAAGARDTVSINYRVPSVLVDGNQAVVVVTGKCRYLVNNQPVDCPPIPPYTNTFTVLVILPTPTPLPTGTFTATPTITPTPTYTPTATWTPTATATAPAFN